jgi:hypothetical protein
MQWRSVLWGLLLVVPAAAGCVTDERSWMKLNEKYTTEEFRRDREACMKGGKIDDVCMRSRGWVAVNPGTKAEAPRDPHARDLAPPTTRERRY